MLPSGVPTLTLVRLWVSPCFQGLQDFGKFHCLGLAEHDSFVPQPYLLIQGDCTEVSDPNPRELCYRHELHRHSGLKIRSGPAKGGSWAKGKLLRRNECSPLK